MTSHPVAPEPVNAGTRIGHVHLKVADLDRALGFYCDVLGFELMQRMGDQAVNLGGWTIDDLCVVAIGAKAGPLCGNGVVDTGEACDDGNTTDGDGCSATCGIEVTGGDDQPGKAGGGCCSTGTSPTGALVLGAIVLGGVLRRRRRASAM